MKLKHIFYGILCGTTLATTSTSCTDLDETLYDQVDASNYYNTKMDVVRSVFRPFEHAYWSIMPRQALNELAADQIMTCTRDGWWEDAGKWRRLHYHTWTDTNDNIQTEWRGCYQGIGQRTGDISCIQLDRHCEAPRSLYIPYHHTGRCLELQEIENHTQESGKQCKAGPTLRKPQKGPVCKVCGNQIEEIDNEVH